MSYTALLDGAGRPRVDMVRADDGSFVLTGKSPFGDDLDLDHITGDTGPTKAYRAWVAAGGVLGESVPVVRPRQATTYQLMSAFTDDQRAAYPTAAKAWDQRLFGARGTPWPEDNIKIGRIAKAIGTTPAAWFDAALALAAG